MLDEMDYEPFVEYSEEQLLNEENASDSEDRAKQTNCFHKKTKNLTSREQYYTMATFLKQNQDIAKRCQSGIEAKHSSNTRWTELVDKLNHIGPSTRSLHKWKKVWADYKNYIRKKSLADPDLKNLSQTDMIVIDILYPNGFVGADPLKETTFTKRKAPTIAPYKIVESAKTPQNLSVDPLHEIPEFRLSKPIITIDHKEVVADDHERTEPKTPAVECPAKKTRLSHSKDEVDTTKRLQTDAHQKPVECPSKPTRVEPQTDSDNADTNDDEPLLPRKVCRRRKALLFEQSVQLQKQSIQQNQTILKTLQSIGDYMKKKATHDAQMLEISLKNHQINQEMLEIKRAKLEFLVGTKNKKVRK